MVNLPLQKLVQDMEPGDWGFTVPWGMSLDEDGSVWLNSHYSVKPSPGGTVTLFILKEQDGFRVWRFAGCRHKWTPSKVTGTWRGFRVLESGVWSDAESLEKVLGGRMLEVPA